MIDGVPEVRDFLASGLAWEVTEGKATFVRTTPAVHRIINAALVARGRENNGRDLVQR